VELNAIEASATNAPNSHGKLPVLLIIKISITHFILFLFLFLFLLFLPFFLHFHTLWALASRATRTDKHQVG
jgi:hypothetical protein